MASYGFHSEAADEYLAATRYVTTLITHHLW